MRLPVNKVYRAFPELDRFDDERCEQLVQHVRRSRRYLLFFGPGVVTFASVAVVVALTAAATAAMRRPSDAMAYAVPLTFIALIAACGMMGLVTRDALLRRAIAAAIADARCVGCRFSLLGLRIDSGTVRCPECGREHVLKAIGLEPADLMVPDAGRASS